MKTKPSKLPLVALPPKARLALFLIREELKSRKFFNGLRQVGLDYTYYQPHLDEAILNCVGLDSESDEVFDLYYALIEKRCTKIREDETSVMKQALKVYVELRMKK